MKVFVIVLLSVAINALTVPQLDKECPDKDSKYQMRQFRIKLHRHQSSEPLKVSCVPTEQLVGIPVPDGFDQVTPAEVIVHRCGGHTCQRDNHCVPTKDGNTTQTVAVMATKGNDDECVQVEVVVHEECECRCKEKECNNSYVFDKESCSCKCPQGEKERCEQRGEQFTFYEEQCSCQDSSNI